MWLLLGLIGLVCSAGPTITVLNPDILQTEEKYIVMSQGELSEYFDDETFNHVLTCRNGGLQIIDSTKSSYMSLSYFGAAISNETIKVTQ